MKTKIILLAFILLAGSVLNAQDNISAAKEMIEAERYSTAENILEQQANHGDPETNYLLVKVYLDQDKNKEAEDFVKTHFPNGLSESDPINRAAYARYLFSTEKTAAAQEIINSILDDRKNQKNPQLLLSLARVVIEEKNGNANDALTWLGMAEKRDKNNPEIDIAKGLAYRKLSDASNAFLSYQNAIKKDPKNVTAHYLMGKIFRSQKNADVYMEHFMKAYSIDSNYAPVLEELYNHYYYRDIKESKKFLEKYIANTDYSIQNDYYLADIFYLNKEYDKAIKLANQIIASEKINSQPRLYKLIAYSYAKSGDTTKARASMEDYFSKENPEKLIAADYELIATITANQPGMENEAIINYIKAIELDSLLDNKIKYAQALVDLYKKLEDYLNQAVWLGNLYNWKSNSNNVDLFNWGLAYYKAKDYIKTDSVFIFYTTKYPEDIYGHYWRAQANASIDTAMTDSLAIPHYLKVVELGEKDKEKNSKMLMKAYGYLGGYEANIKKNYQAAIRWFEKYLELDKENEQIKGYIESLNKWLDK